MLTWIYYTLKRYTVIHNVIFCSFSNGSRYDFDWLIKTENHHRLVATRYFWELWTYDFPKIIGSSTPSKYTDGPLWLIAYCIINSFSTLPRDTAFILLISRIEYGIFDLFRIMEIIMSTVSPSVTYHSVSISYLMSH